MRTNYHLAHVWRGVLLAGVLATPAVRGGDWYVATNGSDSADGSLATPWATVAHAVAAGSVVAGDVIHLKSGTYTQSGITVGKALTITGNSSTDTILQAAATPFTASGNIFTFNATGTVQKLTLRHGNVSGFGGAVLVGNGYNFAFDSCLFASNAVNGTGVGGGAVGANNSGATLSFLNCQFLGNRLTSTGTTYHGGAIGGYNVSLWVSNCTFAANTSGGYGGAIGQATSGRRIEVYQSLFTGNAATNSGGAIYCIRSATTLLVGNCTIASNSAGTYGGGIFTEGATAATTQTIFNTTIYSNSAANGGGVYHWSNTGIFLNFYNCTLFANSATNKGGGIYDDWYSGNPGGCTLYSTIVAGNTAPTGPDLYAQGGNAATLTRCILGNGTGGGTFTNGDPNSAANYIGTSGSPIPSGLLPLAGNGGLRPTCALQPTSRAVDHGTNTLNLAYDGRGPGCPRVAGAQCDIGAYELKALTYSDTTFHESIPLNDGSITNSLLVTVSGDTFNATNGEDLVASGKVTTNNVPAGLSVVITNISPTQVVVTLTGTASPNTAGDSVLNLTLNFLDAAFASSNAASIYNASRSDLGVTFYGASANRSLSYNLTNFTESVANDGTIASTLIVTLYGDTFNAAPGVNVTNYPANLTPVVTKLTDLTVSLAFSGTSLLQRAANNITNLTVTFLDSAFSGGNASGVTNYLRSDLQMSFLNPTLTYSGDTFTEAAANDGSIATSLTLTLAGDTFSATNGENLVASGKVTTNNVPAGLTAVVTRTSAQTAALSLVGRATPHNAANSVTNLTIAFQDTAFTYGAAAAVTNATGPGLKVNFQNPALAYGGTAFTESPTTPGVIPNTLTITLVGDTLNASAGNDLVALGKVAVSNLPAGLTAVLTMNTSTQATLALTGLANPNEASNSVSNLTVLFLNAAFTGANAAIVTNAAVTNLTVTFVSPRDWYVATTGNDSAPGDGSPANPYATLQKAINMAQVAANDVIHLAAGFYTQTNINANAKFLTITGASSTSTILQAASTPFTASSGILLGLSAGGYIRNLTLRYGNAGSAFGSAGAVALGAGDTYFDNCVFATNACGGNGGAVWGTGTATYTFRNCQFVGNIASNSGGAIYTWNTRIAVSNCTFQGNTATNNGGAICRDNTTISSISVYNSLFTGNAATNNGGAIYGNKDTLLTIWNSTLASNLAVTGNGAACCVLMNDSSMTCQVCNSTLTMNTAGGGGGAIYFWTQSDRPLYLYNSTLFANSATAYGGGVYLDVYGSTSAYNLFSTIVASNTVVTSGPDIYARSGGAGTVTNSLIGNSSSAGTGLLTGNPNAGGSYIGTSGAPINPLLAPLANNGGALPTCALLDNSPAIDHGLNPLGLAWDERGDGYSRAYKILPDMGAYEYGAHQPRKFVILFR